MGYFLEILVRWLVFDFAVPLFVGVLVVLCSRSRKVREPLWFTVPAYCILILADALLSCWVGPDMDLMKAWQAWYWALSWINLCVVVGGLAAVVWVGIRQTH